MDQFFWGSMKEAKSIEETTVQRFLFLGVSKLEIKHPAMAFNNGHAIELSLGMAIGEGAEVAPIDLALMPRWGFKANEGPSFSGSTPNLPQIIP